MDETKKIEIQHSDQSKGIMPPPIQTPYATNLEKISLINIEEIKVPSKDFTQMVKDRRSIRSYLNKKVTLEELSYLLWCTQGVRKIIKDFSIKRTVPSAGSRHPLETYLVIHRVKDLRVGIYRYLSLEHALLKIQENPKIMGKIVKACNGQEFIRSSAVVFIWVADIYRMKWRHGERGYRYVFLDAGHVGQNLYLASNLVQCGACTIGVFLDDQINQILGIDGTNEFVVYMAAIGKSKNFN